MPRLGLYESSQHLSDRVDRSPQGARKRVAERRAFVVLTERGMSAVEAARVVGVDPNTGREWLYGRPRGRGRKARLSAAEELVREALGGPNGTAGYVEEVESVLRQELITRGAGERNQP